MKTLILSLTALLFLFSCGVKENTASNKPTVAISLPPYVYFVKKIALDTVNIALIVPPQSNPHLFEPTPKQVKDVKDAKLWLRSREHFENKILSVLKEQAPNLVIVDLSKNISDDEEDRHIWLSPRLAKDQAELIAEGLIQLNPQHEALYKQNLNILLTELTQVDKQISEKLAPFKNQAILTSHPAFGLFCKEYNMVQLSIECEGKDPLPQDLEKTLLTAKIHNIAKILTQPQYNNRGAEIIADHMGVSTASVDPYSSDYIENLKTITHLIASP